MVGIGSDREAGLDRQIGKKVNRVKITRSLATENDDFRWDSGLEVDDRPFG